MEEELKPCPFCGAGETIILENKGVWTGRGYGAPSSVEVHHWCTEDQGQPSRMISRIGRDEASAIAAWNRRSTIAAPAQEPVAAPAKEGGQDTPAAVSAGDLYAVLRNMHWTDGKLAVIEVKDLRLGVQTYSGELLDAVIVRATTRGEA